MTSAQTDTIEYVWTVEQGERERISFPVTRNGSPQDLTGWTIDAKIKTEPGGAVLHVFPQNMINVDGDTIELTVPAPVSTAWTWTVGWWRVVITAPDPDPADPESYRVIKGAFLVERD
jgi:hypothetical protein